MTWDVYLGYFTGLRLLVSDLDPMTLVRTVVLIHLCDSIMCRLFAHNNGYPKNLWTLLGFIFGIWAIIVLILLPRRRAAVPLGVADEAAREAAMSSLPSTSASTPPNAPGGAESSLRKP